MRLGAIAQCTSGWTTLLQVGAVDELRERLFEAGRAWHVERGAERDALRRAYKQLERALSVGISRSAAATIVGVARQTSARAVTMPSKRRISVGPVSHQLGVHWRDGVIYPPTLDAHQRRDVERAKQRLENAGNQLAAARENTARTRAVLTGAIREALAAQIPRREIARVAGIARDSVSDLLK